MDVASHFRLSSLPFANDGGGIIETAGVARARAELERLLAQAPRTIFVESLAGAGKTVLLRGAAENLRRAGRCVFFSDRPETVDESAFGDGDLILLDEVDRLPAFRFRELATAAATHDASLVAAVPAGTGDALDPAASIVRVEGLSAAETADFLRDHLARVGARGFPFAAEAVARLAGAAGGSVRAVKALAGAALVEAMIDGAPNVSAVHAGRAIEQFDGSKADAPASNVVPAPADLAPPDFAEPAAIEIGEPLESLQEAPAPQLPALLDTSGTALAARSAPAATSVPFSRAAAILPLAAAGALLAAIAWTGDSPQPSLLESGNPERAVPLRTAAARTDIADAPTDSPADTPLAGAPFAEPPPTDAPAVQEPAKPPATAESPPPAPAAAPAGSHVVIRYSTEMTNGVEQAYALAGHLQRAGWGEPRVSAVAGPVRRGSIRLFYAGDRSAAAALDRELSGLLPSAPVQLVPRAAKPRRGTIEVWIPES